MLTFILYLLAFVGAAAILAFVRKLATPEPVPDPRVLITSIDLRLYLREAMPLQQAHDFGQAAIDHLHETFNDDESIWYMTYEVPPATQVPE